MYKVQLDDKVVKYLQKLDADLKKRIFRKLRSFKNNPRPNGCVGVKGMKNLFRVRIGDYRIVYQIEDKKLLVLVVRVGHRKDVYNRI
ncbi:MAG: type II toxin-antitoxin system RelE/ParE family toxin [Anaerohalosphaeraceae bacterium]|nr:type II toxin-antitoxin system RelE/ParE family toxin [Anaerohalosphaeraceae bacterium]